MKLTGWRITKYVLTAGEIALVERAHEETHGFGDDRQNKRDDYSIS
jgi:hypothetical protein